MPDAEISPEQKPRHVGKGRGRKEQEISPESQSVSPVGIGGGDSGHRPPGQGNSWIKKQSAVQDILGR